MLSFPGNPELERLCRFYEEMKDHDIALKQAYSLPPIDEQVRNHYRIEAKMHAWHRDNRVIHASGPWREY